MIKSILLAAALLLLCVGLTHAQTVPTQTANFNLTWVDNSANEDGFNIERAPAQAGPFVKVGSVLANMIKYTDSIANDTGNKQFCYRVQAFNTAGPSAYSNIACATTPTIIIPPGTPGNLNVSVTVTVNVGQ